LEEHQREVESLRQQSAVEVSQRTGDACIVYSGDSKILEEALASLKKEGVEFQTIKDVGADNERKRLKSKKNERQQEIHSQAENDGKNQSFFRSHQVLSEGITSPNQDNNLAKEG